MPVAMATAHVAVVAVCIYNVYFIVAVGEPSIEDDKNMGIFRNGASGKLAGISLVPKSSKYGNEAVTNTLFYSVIWLTIHIVYVHYLMAGTCTVANQICLRKVLEDRL